LNIDGILSFGKIRHCSNCGKHLLPRHIDYRDNDSLEFFEGVTDSGGHMATYQRPRDEFDIPLE
jgi:hypothetical protein